MKSGNKKSILAVIMMSVMLLAFGAACGDTKASEKEYADWYESNRSDLEDAMLTYAKRMMEELTLPTTNGLKTLKNH